MVLFTRYCLTWSLLHYMLRVSVLCRYWSYSSAARESKGFTVILEAEEKTGSFQTIQGFRYE